MFDFIFGCSHRNLSRIWTLPVILKRVRNGWPEIRGGKRTYRVCLTCGREFEIDWDTFGEVKSGAYKPAGEREGAVYE